MNREVLRTKKAVLDFLRTGALSSFDRTKLGWGALRASQLRSFPKREVRNGE